MLKYDYEFVPNGSDDQHCFQACIRMVWQGLTGERMDGETAEEVTGFTPGKHTWPFLAELFLADAGLQVTCYEDFRPESFVSDPYAEISRQCDGDEATISFVYANSEVDAQIDLVKRCLEHPRIKFVPGIPDVATLMRVVGADNGLTIAGVNSHKLRGEEGYSGHAVLVRDVGEDYVEIDNPGPPPSQKRRVDTATFLSAWSDPTPELTAFSLPLDPTE